MENLKKVELHLHLDGSVRPSTIASILNMDEQDVRKKVCTNKDTKDLKDYLSKFDLPISIMQTKDNLIRISRELALDLKNDNVIYAEIRFAPIFHMKQGLTMDEVITSVLEGLKQVPIKTNLILCMMRGSSYEDNYKIIEAAYKFLNKGVVGIDLAGDEKNYPVNNFNELFKSAKDKNIPFTIHAGEADDYKSIDNAIKQKAKRIGHGVRAIENNNTIKLIKENNITLEICPISNIDTKIYESIKDHPIKKLYDENINITISTDNRTVSNTTLNDTYKILQNTFNFTKEDFIKMNQNAIQASFISDKEKELLLKELINQ